MIFDEQDMKNVRKLQESEVKSRRVVGRGLLVSDASEIRSTKSFQEALERAGKLAPKARGE